MSNIPSQRIPLYLRLIVPRDGGGCCAMLMRLHLHLGNGGIIFELIKWRPGDRKARQQYPLPAPPPYTRQRAVVRSGG